ncbi:MAG TPA: amino acid adenylation domain-containing protein, partial [Pyrinomonadaceae bacterium]|nr:amino acid adenylation domain-containing protein [Pyrinomonadaceae bacterium]
MAAVTDRLKQLNELSPAKRALLFRMMQQEAARSAETIPRRQQHDSAPLSFAQQRLWFLDQFAPGLSLYNIPAAIRLTGSLNVEALTKSLREIVRRHESLRTSFTLEDQQPRQRIMPPFVPSLTILNLEGRGEEEQRGEVKRVIAGEVETGFDLSAGPMLRAKLLRLRAEEHILVVTMHHIVSDGWSMSVFFREVIVLYEAFAIGRPSPLPELPIQYPDFAAWQRERLTESYLDEQLEFWKQQLGGTLPALDLPADRPRPAVQTFRGETRTLLVPESTVTRLKQLGNSEDATLFMVTLAIFQLLLHRYTSQHDIATGVPVAGRERVELEGLIGFFVNTVVMRTRAIGNQTFRELLRQVREVALGALAHQDVPFEKLVEELQPERDMSRSPLFQAMFMLQNTAATDVTELRSLAVEPLKVESRSSKFDVTLSLSEVEQGLRGSLEYNIDLFLPERMEQFSRHFCRLAEAVAIDPDRNVSTLPMLTASERRVLLEEYNDNAQQYPRDLTLADLFEQQVARTPEAIALIAGDERLTYTELNHEAEQLALHLARLGVGPESLVGVCVERSARLVTALLAVLKSGGVYLPLDPAYPAERLRLMLEDSDAGVLLTERESIGDLPVSGVKVAYVDEVDREVEGKCSRRGLQPEHLAYVIYTSGSTGKPKGVAVTHSSLVNFLFSMQQEPGLTSRDVLLAVTSLSFDIAALELYLPLTVGATVHVCNSAEATDGERLLQLLASSKATAMQATPATWRMLINRGWRPEHKLKVLCGGEALTRDIAEQLLSNGAPLWNLYGPTETTIWSTLKLLRSNEETITIGRPIANTQVYLLDHHLEPVPAGVIGEVYIAGDGLARGYLHRPDLTAEKFLPDPFVQRPGARMYRVGDVARFRAGGEIEYLGRTDQQVKVRGYRIELGEIETALSERSEVRECAVVVREDGEGEKQLVAFVVPEGPVEPHRTDLREGLRGRLPDYMVPAIFVFVEALPLTTNGKLNRRALLDVQVEQQARDFDAAQTPTQEMLANIWSEVLRVERIGINDNFFELGGHSLLATQVISQVRQNFHVELALRNLFETPTVSGLASTIEKLMAEGFAGEAKPLVRVPRDHSLPLSFAQQRLWFIEQLVTGKAVYNLPGAIRLRGPLNTTALELSLTEIVRRHESLRTFFATVDGQPVQVISSDCACPLPIIELSDVPESEREARVREIAFGEAKKPFDLSRGPVIRVLLLRLGAEDHVVLFTLHHISSDGWSMGILIREVATLYHAFGTGRPSPLPELPIQYADFALWQREWLQGEV